MKPTVGSEVQRQKQRQWKNHCLCKKATLCCRSWSALIPGGMARGFWKGHEHQLFKSQSKSSHFPMQNHHPFSLFIPSFLSSFFLFLLSFFSLFLIFPLSEVTLSGPPRAQWVHLVFFPFFLLLTQARIQIHSKS